MKEYSIQMTKDIILATNRLNNKINKKRVLLKMYAKGLMKKYKPNLTVQLLQETKTFNTKMGFYYNF